MVKFFPKIVLFACVFATLGLTVFAQCEGVYIKPSARKILTEKTYIYEYDDDFNVKDLTGDGRIDVIGFVRDASNQYTKISILTGTGAGDFGAPIQINLSPASITPGSNNFKIADFNGDGKNDFVALLNTNPPTVVVYQNNGSGAFTSLTPTILTAGEEIVNFVDINSDNRADLITSRFTQQPTGYFFRLANADGTFGVGFQLATANYRVGADFNSDGKVDFPFLVEVGASQTNYALRFYYNTGNGVFTMSNGTPIVIDSRYPVSMKAANFNDDAKPDLLFQTQGDSVTSPKLVLLLNLGNGNFSRTEFPILNQNAFYKPSIKDFNGDGFQDIFVYKGEGLSTGYTIYTNNGAGNFTSREYNGRSPGIPAGDLDGDNKADFVRVSNFDLANATPIKVFDETQLTVYKNVCNRFGETRIVDFDGDGRPDPTFWRESDGRWRYQRRFYPFGTPLSVVTVNWGQAGDVPMPGDYDGDGKTDIAVFRPSNGSWYWINSSNNSMSGAAFGASGDRPVASDYNGDGRTDLAVYRPSTGAWYVLFSGTNQFYGAQFGASEDSPVPQDYDGDGKTDFAVFRPSSGVWYVLRSSDGTAFGEAWGSSTDTLVPADYDGDGRADIAVFRAGSWFIRRSNNLPSLGRVFGNPTDISQPGDWSGDGIWDLAVYRPSTKIWYMSSYGSIQFDNATGEVPVASLNKSY